MPEMMAEEAGAPALAQEQDKKVQELSNNRLAAVRCGPIVPVGGCAGGGPRAFVRREDSRDGGSGPSAE